MFTKLTDCTTFTKFTSCTKLTNDYELGVKRASGYLL